MRHLLFIYLLLSTLSAPAQSFHNAAARRIPLLDTSGRARPLQLPAQKMMALLFLSPECPLCKSYAPRLRELYQQFAQEVSFVGIIPGADHSGTAIRIYQQEYRLPFPLLQDKDRRLSTWLTARVTPEVMLFDSQGQLLYRGLIDNSIAALGKRRTVVTEHYLAAAIRHKGQVQPTRTTAIGCLINIE